MTPISRDNIPKSCPKCQSVLKSYHGPGPVTRLICVEKCSGYQEVVIIDHMGGKIGGPEEIYLCT